MCWIKSFLIIPIAVSVSACANQNSLLPLGGKDMLSIYRDALRERDSGTAPVFPDEASALCAELVSKRAQARCVKKADAILTRHRVAIRKNPNRETLDYHAYSRDAKNEIEQLFPRLPNPDLVIYVYPHLATRARAPIPGYSSVIPLYERVEYRLPGEAISSE